MHMFLCTYLTLPYGSERVPTQPTEPSQLRHLHPYFALRFSNAAIHSRASFCAFAIWAGVILLAIKSRFLVAA